MQSANSQNDDQFLDLIVVGGGINGAGIAADAAGRGLSVGLYEARDFASATSSASSKLIHGGLRYLEHYEFRLVSEALKEREVLLRKAPHVVTPLRFRLPHRPFLRPAWMIRLGLFLYDHLGKRTTLQGSKTIDLSASGNLNSQITKGFEYSDCWVDDARLVLLNIQAAQALGAEMMNYCQVERAEPIAGGWLVSLFDSFTNTRFTRKSRTLVNAAGPWVKSLFDQSISMASPYNIRLIKGSHIVVKRIHDEEQAYILQNEDDRIVFVIPYLDDYSLIGTTDLEYKGDPRDTQISEQETDYLLNVVNQHFVNTLKREDVVWSYSGVRPLCDDESSSPQAITRDYTLALQADNEHRSPLLSVFGGKLTTYRKLAESAMKKLTPFYSEIGDSWTHCSTLPGGDFSCSRDLYANNIHQDYPFLSARLANRYTSQFGSNTHTLLQNVKSKAELGIDFGHEVYQAEIDYMIEHEFVKHPDDFLWRRTKMGVVMSHEEQLAVGEYISRRVATEETPARQMAG